MNDQSQAIVQQYLDHADLSDAAYAMMCVDQLQELSQPPELGDLLWAWRGRWPHEDDRLRLVVAYWLEWVCEDSSRAGMMKESQVREYNDGGRAFWYVHPDEGIGYRSGPQCAHLTPGRAVRELKRRLLNKFPDVKSRMEVRVSEVRMRQFHKGQIDSCIQAQFVEAGFRTDLPIERKKEHKNRRHLFRQVLAAPSWIQPESNYRSGRGRIRVGGLDLGTGSWQIEPQS